MFTLDLDDGFDMVLKTLTESENMQMDKSQRCLLQTDSGQGDIIRSGHESLIIASEQLQASVAV